MTFGADKFIAGGLSIGTNLPCFAISNDFGQSWGTLISTTAAGGAGVQPRCLRYGAGRFVAMIASTVCRVSTDGAIWTDEPTPIANKAYLEFANGVFLWLTAASDIVYRSPTGLTGTWTPIALPALGDTSWNSVAFDTSTSTWTAISNTRAAKSTDNGLTWSAGGTLPHTNYIALAAGNGITVAVLGTSVITVDYSLNGGTTWATATFPTGLATTYTEVLFRQGAFFVFSSIGSTAWVSLDGVTWAAANQLSHWGDAFDIWCTAGDTDGHYAGVATKFGGTTHAAVGVC